MRKTNIAVIGAGNIAQNIHIPILSGLSNATLVALMDRNRSRGRALGTKFSIPTVVQTLDELLALDALDAVSICTSTDSHRDLAVACLEAGKDVLIERPIAPSSKQAQEIVDAAKANDRKLMVAMNTRFRPDVSFMKNQIEGGHIGMPYYMKAGWLAKRSTPGRWVRAAEQSGGGVMMDLGIVLLDLILYLYGYDNVKTVRATTHYHKNSHVEDFITVYLTFADDRVATIEASWAQHTDREVYYCNAFSEKGSLFLHPLKVITKNDGEMDVRTNIMREVSGSEMYYKSYKSELQHFANAAQDLVPAVSTGEEALIRMKIIEAIYASASERKEITLEA